jgi:hypothetical protein
MSSNSGAIRGNRSSTVHFAVASSLDGSSGQPSGQAPRLRLLFWNMDCNNSRAENQPTVATTELKSIESHDAVVLKAAEAS